VLLVHGGGWENGDRTQLRGYGIALGRLGFVAVACEYRLSGEAPWPAQLHDVKAALRWMRAERESLGIHPDRISVSGNSAGAHLALLIGATPNRPDFEGDGGSAGAGTECAAVIAIYPPTDLRGVAEMLSGPTGKLFGSGVSADVVEQASPIVHCNKDFPPTQLIHGNRDTIVPGRASLDMYAALEEAGAPVELHMFNDAPHAFDTDPALGRQCTQLMTLFLDRHVPG
jgi:acetyl esterase/lipase